MVEFNVKEVAMQLETTTQNIYKKVDKLICKGMAYKDDKGHTYIYDSGLEFLKQEKIKRNMVANSKYFVSNKDLENGEEKHFATEHETVANIYKKLYEDLKLECEFWKNKFEEKDRAYNEITSQLLLSSGKDEIKKSRNFFSRFFVK